MTAPTTQQIDWHLRARQLIAEGIAHQAYIDGRYVDARDGSTFDCISPIDGTLLVKVAACDQADIDDAVIAARRSVAQSSWSGIAPANRKRILLKFADLIESNGEQLALLETLDMG